MSILLFLVRSFSSHPRINLKKSLTPKIPLIKELGIRAKRKPYLFYDKS